MPAVACAANVRFLGSLVAAAKEQDDSCASDCIVDPIARSNIDPKFPNAIPAEFVIPEVTKFDAIDPAIDRDASFDIPQLRMSVLVDIPSVLSQLMANLVHRVLSFINENCARSILYMFGNFGSKQERQSKTEMSLHTGLFSLTLFFGQ